MLATFLVITPKLINTRIIRIKMYWFTPIQAARALFWWLVANRCNLIQKRSIYSYIPA